MPASEYHTSVGNNEIREEHPQDREPAMKHESRKTAVRATPPGSPNFRPRSAAFVSRVRGDIANPDQAVFPSLVASGTSRSVPVFTS